MTPGREKMKGSKVNPEARDQEERRRKRENLVVYPVPGQVCFVSLSIDK